MGKALAAGQKSDLILRSLGTLKSLKQGMPRPARILRKVSLELSNDL